MLNMSLNSAKVTLPASIRDELRRAMSLKCPNKVHLSSKMKVKDIIDLMFHLFHGCPRKEIISSVDLLLQREGPYSRIFEEKEKSSARPQSNSIERLHVLKLLHH